MVGFGRCSAIASPNFDLLSSAEFTIGSYFQSNFEAERKEGSKQICDIGAGLYVNEANRWTLAGIMSFGIFTENPLHSTMYTFTNILKYLVWIQSTNNSALVETEHKLLNF